MLLQSSGGTELNRLEAKKASDTWIINGPIYPSRVDYQGIEKIRQHSI